VDGLVLGSYEQQLLGDPGLAGASVAADPLTAAPAGPSAVISGNVRYRFGRTARYIEAETGGFLHSFRDLHVRPVSGGNVDVRGGWNKGRASIVASAAALYRPTLMLNATPSAPIDPAGDAVAPVDPTNGVASIQSTTKGVTSGFDYQWNTRHHTSLSFGYLDAVATGLVPTNSRNLVESLTHSWGFQRTLNLQLQYHYSDLTMEVPLQADRPTDSHAARVGLEWRKRLSRTRTLALGAATGAMKVRTISSLEAGPLEYVAPSVSAQARLDIGRTWSVAADAHRDVTVLDAVTQQSFLTDVMSMWLGGTVGDTWGVVLSGSFSRGAPHEGEIGSFEATTGRAQLQYGFASCCTLVGTYSYYSHLLRDISHLTPGFPNRAENNAVRVGMTLWLPVYGRFVGTGGFQIGRN
jgi:hypothetical protein